MTQTFVVLLLGLWAVCMVAVVVVAMLFVSGLWGCNGKD